MTRFNILRDAEDRWSFSWSPEDEEIFQREWDKLTEERRLRQSAKSFSYGKICSEDSQPQKPNSGEKHQRATNGLDNLHPRS